MKKQFILTASILLVLAMMASVSAAGVVIPYLKDNVLKVYPGDSTTFNFGLQNGGGAIEPVTFKANILAGSEIAFLTGDTFNVPANSQVPVTIRIGIPATAVPGTVYPIAVSFTVITAGSSSGVNLGTGMEAGFSVLVVEKPAEQQKPAPQISTTWIVIIAIIILILILWLILKKKKK